MSLSAPRIGFDRFVPLDWAATALDIRAGMAGADDLAHLFEQAGISAGTRKRTHTVLNRLWLDPPRQLADYASRGVAMRKARPELPVAALCWGMAIAAYPFFGKIAELIGRLSAIQGDCSSAELHRRMAETYGEREDVRRATRVIIQSLSTWSIIERVQKGQRIIRLQSIAIDDSDLTAWLIEASVRYSGKPVSVPGLQSLHVLFPFTLPSSLSYVVSNNPNLSLRSEGMSNQYVGLRASV